MPSTEPFPHPGGGAFEEIHPRPRPAHPRGKARSWMRTSARAAGSRTEEGNFGRRCLGRRRPGHRGSAGRREPRPRPSGQNTFRRKLATTCSKGYLNTSCTSTVTPIPARRPRLRQHTTARAPSEPGRRRPSPGSLRGVGIFSLPFSNFRNFIVHSEKQTVGTPPFPSPSTSASLGCWRGRCWAPGRCRLEASEAAPPRPGSGSALPRSDHTSPTPRHAPWPRHAPTASPRAPLRTQGSTSTLGSLEPCSWGFCHHPAWSLKPLLAALKRCNKYISYPPSEFRDCNITLLSVAQLSVAEANDCIPRRTWAVASEALGCLSST